MRRAALGYSVIELVFVAGLVTTMAGLAVPPTLTTIDDTRTAGAARYMATRLQRARMDAIKRSADVAIQFVPIDGSYGFATYVDGNGSGVRTREIAGGVDRRLDAVERLVDQFPGIDFGATTGLPAVEPGGQPPGGDPVRFGPGHLASFSAAGTASSGSLYIRSRRGAQYVVRVYGDTGRVRILKFETRPGKWTLF
jgi:hypothetical protein